MGRARPLQPRKRPRQRRAVETRDRIVDAAARIFATHGYAAGTTNRIAAEAGLSIGSLYQYFPNKDAILVALVERHVDDGLRRFRRALARGWPQTLEARLALVVGTLVDGHRDHPRLHQVLFEEAPHPRWVLDRLHEVERQAVDLMVEALAATPEVRHADVRVAARITVATAESLVHRLVATPEPAADPGAVGDEIVRLLLAYLTGPPSRTAER